MAAPITSLVDRHVWTDQDTDTIVAMRREGAADADIMKAIGVGASSFNMQIHRLMKDRSLDLPRANRPDWGQPWTDERDSLLAKLRNENLLHDDEIAEVLGVTVQKARTRVDHLRDIGRDVRGAKKGRKPGPQATRVKAAAGPVKTSPPAKTAPALPAPVAPVPVVAPMTLVDRTGTLDPRLEALAELRRDLARKRRQSTNQVERDVLGVTLLEAVDVEEEYLDLLGRMSVVEARIAELGRSA